MSQDIVGKYTSTMVRIWDIYIYIYREHMENRGKFMEIMGKNGGQPVDSRFVSLFRQNQMGNGWLSTW